MRANDADRDFMTPPEAFDDGVARQSTATRVMAKVGYDARRCAAWHIDGRGVSGEKLMLRQIAVGALLVTFGAAGMLSAQQPAGAPPAAPPVKRNILQRTDVPGTNLELIYANLEIAPGFRAGRHSHP